MALPHPGFRESNGPDRRMGEHDAADAIVVDPAFRLTAEQPHRQAPAVGDGHRGEGARPVMSPMAQTPGTGGTIGLPPVATTMWSALYSNPFISITWASTKRAVPLIQVMPRSST